MARIKIKNSQVKDKAPVPSDLVAGELAINTHADSPAIYLKDTAGAVRKIAGAGAIGGTPATETAAGIVELATAAETTTGTDNTRAVHPAGLKVELDKKANQATTYTKIEADGLLAAKAPLASPALTGTPTAPTAAAGTNTTQVATTAFVTDVVAKENLWGRTGTVVSPANAGDQVHTATGKLTVGGTAAAPAVSLDPGATGLPFVRDSSGRIGVGNAAPSMLVECSQSTNGVTALAVENTNAGANARADVVATTSTADIRLIATGPGYTGISGWANAGVVSTSSGSTNGLILNTQAGGISFQFGTAQQAKLSTAGIFTLGDGTNNAVSLDPGTTGSPLVRDSLGRVLVGKATAPTGTPNSSLTAEGGLVLKSPDGKYWNITVSNAGALSAAAL